MQAPNGASILLTRVAAPLDGATADVSSDTYQDGFTRPVYEEAKAKGRRD